MGRLAYLGVSWGHVCTVGFIGTTVLELRSLKNIERIYLKPCIMWWFLRGGIIYKRKC